MTNIHLLRHGHIDNPKQIFYGPDIRLSERGKRQIRSITEDMKNAGLNVSRIVHSPYVRTTETAGIVASVLGIKNVTTDDRLKEWQVGDWYGKPLAEFYAYTKYAEHPDAKLPSDIEPLDSCATRVRMVIDDLLRAFPDETTLIISHREPMASAVLQYQKKGWDAIHDLHFPLASSWELGFASEKMPSLVELRFDRSSVE